jgi:hypothetical protein
MCRVLFAAALLTFAASAQSDSNAPPLLVVLSDTGTKRDGLAVLTHSPDESRYLAALQRGFSGRLLRLYRAAQSVRFKRDGVPIEPAYLALTRNEGGFPRYGFVLNDVVKSNVANIDLHFKSDLSGRFGAMDQIFPHELMHVIMRQLAGEAPAGGANQVHAIAVRTDPQTAFDEGLAEVAQVLAVDDPNALPETRVLASDSALLQRAEARLADYRRALTARWAPVPRARMTFVLWFSATEQVLRYHAVKANRFAFEPPIPEHLLRGPDVYHAYLLENLLPGDKSDERKPPGQVLSTDGGVSALFTLWLTDKALQSGYREESFYLPFAVAPKDVSPVENAYLKLFHVLDHAKPHDAMALVRGWQETFPDDVRAVRRIMKQMGLDPDWRRPGEIWLANSDFKTGTTLFDQFRGLPRDHTFDLNAASLVDLMSVKGMTLKTAEAIRRASPFATLTDLRHVPEVSQELAARFSQMEAAMKKLKAAAVEDTATESLSAILKPYVYRAALWLVLSSLLAAAIYARTRPVRWWRAVLNGFSAVLIGFCAGWYSDALGGAISWLLPIIMFGLPAAIWELARRKSALSGLRVFAAWTFAGLVPFLMTRAWF